MAQQRHFVVVYQFGKVASSSIVDSLNASALVDAHQSHFLGAEALKRIVVNATDKELSPYFRQHMVGQLVANIDLTYQVNRVMSGDDPRKMTVISLTRQPLDWFRSAIQQDIAGYKDRLIGLGAGTGLTEAEALERGLTDMIGQVADNLETCGGTRDIVDCVLGAGVPSLLRRLNSQDDFAKRMLLLALRPLIWFQDHFETCFGLSVHDIPRQDGFWFRPGDPARFVVLRYEDIATTFGPAMEAASIPFNGRIARANVSDGKAFANQIRAAFEGPEAERLGRRLCESDYADYFSYGGMAKPESRVPEQSDIALA